MYVMEILSTIVNVFLDIYNFFSLFFNSLTIFLIREGDLPQPRDRGLERRGEGDLQQRPLRPEWVHARRVLRQVRADHPPLPQ